jgi:hypothetical protein
MGGKIKFISQPIGACEITDNIESALEQFGSIAEDFEEK